MGQLTQKDLHTPLNAESQRKIRGRIDKVVSAQGAAANLTTTEVLDIRGNLREVTFIAAATPGAGESLTIDVQKNGVSILPAPFVFDTELGDTLYRLTTNADVSFVPGAVISVIRTYVAGGTPAPLGANKLTIEIA